MAEGGFAEVMENALSAVVSMAGALYPESGSTMDRVVTQGAAELASALFGGSNAYVAYGDGQKSIEVEAPQVEQAQAVQISAPQEQAVQAVEAPQVQQERGGMEM